MVRAVTVEFITKWSHFMPLFLYGQVHTLYEANVVSVFKILPSV